MVRLALCVELGEVTVVTVGSPAPLTVAVAAPVKLMFLVSGDSCLATTLPVARAAAAVVDACVCAFTIVAPIECLAPDSRDACRSCRDDDDGDDITEPGLREAAVNAPPVPTGAECLGSVASATTCV